MIILGLTGSIGMGKTTTAKMFQALGIPVYYADKTVHQLYKNEAVDVISKNFPTAVSGGIVDRKILSSLVIGHPIKLKKLESLIHPLVHQKEKEFLQTAAQKKFKLVVLDIPLLFETNGINRVNKIAVVSTDPETQRTRVLLRSGMNIKKFDSILERQTSDEDKRAKADFIIDTGKGLDHARRQVAKIVRQLTN